LRPKFGEDLMSEVSQDDKTMGMIAHLSAIVTGFIGPLVIWLINKDKADKEWLVTESKEALNFNITLAIAYFGLTVLAIVTLGIAGLITGPLMLIIWVVSIVLFIVAGLKAKDGISYRYPFAIRLIK
jgi:uncharacterized protein